MNQIYKTDTQKCYDTNADTYLASLQVRLTPLELGPPTSESHSHLEGATDANNENFYEV